MQNDKLEALIMCHYHLLFDDDPMKTECTIGDFGEIISGATPSTAVSEYFCLNGISWLTPKDLTATGRKFIYKGETDISQDAYDSCSTKLLPKGTVLLTSRAPVGTVALAMNEVCTNQVFKSIVPKKEVGSAFIYCFLKDNKSLLDSHASGTTFMEISGNVLKNVPAFIPSQKRLDNFNAYCNTIFGTQKNNELEIDRLTFSDIEYGNRKRITKREEFLDIMEEIIPWEEWVEFVRPYYPAGKRGRPTKGIETMLRMYLLQTWFNLSDEGVEDAIYDSYAFRKFMKID